LAKIWDFWKIVREINPATIREEAARPFCVAAVGTPEEIAALRRIAGIDSPEQRQIAAPHWREAALPLNEETRAMVAGCAFALTLGTEDNRTVPVVTWRLPATDGPARQADLSAILDRFPDLVVALPRALPMFRQVMTARLIAATARANTEISLVSAIPGILPWTAIALPAAAIPDMILLTKNQVMMCLRIAAAYGLPVEPQARIAELGSIVGAAFGWRALARELIGVAPGGIGVVAKGTIAWAATVATGRAAQSFYETGQRPTDKQRRVWYMDAMRRGREAAKNGLDNLRHRGAHDAYEPAA
jgi:uncharacterized protein (DUF697 family)